MTSTLLRCLVLALAPIGGVISLLWFGVSVTSTGRTVATACLLAFVAAMLACIACERKARRLWHMAWAVAMASCSAAGCLVLHAPDGRTSNTSRVQHRFVGGGWAFQRYAIGNVVPEIDQFMLGFRLVPAVDALFTMQQARELSVLTSAIYRDIEADKEFHALGSAMPEAYHQLFGQSYDHGHYFLYVPGAVERHSPHPAILFMHGSGGNFKAYTWLLSKVADQLGMIVIAPSYGMGNWHEPDSSRIAKAVLDDAAKVVAIDQSQVHLMGLSNGGLAVSQVGASMGEHLRTLTFLSPVFDRTAVLSTDFQDKWKGRSVLVITGRQDDRVPHSYVSEMSSAMGQAGASVSLKSIDGANHFMLFSHREVVTQMMTTWLNEHRKT